MERVKLLSVSRFLDFSGSPAQSLSPVIGAKFDILLLSWWRRFLLPFDKETATMPIMLLLLFQVVLLIRRFLFFSCKKTNLKSTATKYLQ